MQGGVAVTVAIKVVLAAAPTGFAVEVDAGLGADGDADAGAEAGMAVFAVGLLLALAGFSILFRSNFLTGAIFCWICICIINITAINKFELYKK